LADLKVACNRLTIPEFAPTEATLQGFFDFAWLRLTIPEFAPTEAFSFLRGYCASSTASRFLNSRRLKLTPAASLIFRCGSPQLASGKASQHYK
jgi:hypothetical protein